MMSSENNNIKDEDEELLNPISELFRAQYPSQLNNVLQTSSQLNRYWQNGPDPLDYINIYINYDAKYDGLYPHYHFVSLGLSDLYGDERIHKRSKASSNELSGYGYEISIKIAAMDKDKLLNAAPKWPLKIIQSLAKYTFSTGCLLQFGDHIPNVLSDFGTRVRHLLVAEDACFVQQPVQTRFGQVRILQLVGCTDEELLCAQKWSARKLLAQFKMLKEFGYDYLLTDLQRSKSIFELDERLKESLSEPMTKDGSFLSFVKSNSFWKLNQLIVELPKTSEFSTYKEIKFFCDFDTAKLMALILKGRLDRSNSFIFNGLDGRILILIPENFSNSECHVSKNCPLKSNKSETQLFLSKSIINELLTTLNTIKIDKEKEKVGLNDVFKAHSDGFLCDEIFCIDDKKEFFLHLTVFRSKEIIDFYERFCKL